MATLKISDKLLTVELDWWEKIAAHRSHLTVPMRAVRSVDVVDDVFTVSTISQARGRSATRIKGVTSIGTVQDETGGSSFVVCQRKGGEATPGIILDLDDATVQRIVVSSPDARRYAEKIGPLIDAGPAGEKS